jgi:predicted transposase YdaD
MFKVLEKTYTKEQILEQIEPAMAIEVKSFYDKLIAEGFEKGAEQGLKQGIKQGIEQGREQGREEGIEQGLEQEKTNTIYRMEGQGFSTSQIAAAVDLPEETVKQILNR